MTEHALALQTSGVVPPAADFRAIFHEHCPYVWRTLRRLGVKESELGDVVQEVFVIVFRHLPELDLTRPMKPWLFGVAYRVARDHRRLARHMFEVSTDETIEVPDPALGPDEQLSLADEQRLVRRALTMLEDDRRAVFILAEIDEVAIPEVARALQIPLNTAYSRLRLARSEFRAAVARLCKHEGRTP